MVDVTPPNHKPLANATLGREEDARGDLELPYADPAGIYALIGASIRTQQLDMLCVIYAKGC